METVEIKDQNGNTVFTATALNPGVVKNPTVNEIYDHLLKRVIEECNKYQNSLTDSLPLTKIALEAGTFHNYSVARIIINKYGELKGLEIKQSLYPRLTLGE